ncbi:MAG: ABC transporter permease [Gammaproteobacteria bacterium]|nr:ABC transporter permease [Gammaproteobacteria bacterium]
MQIIPTLNTLRRNPSTTILLMLQAILTIAIVANLSALIVDRINDINIDSGINEEGLIVLDMYHFAEDFNGEMTLNRDIESLTQLPSISHVSATNQVPFSGSGSSGAYSIQPTSSDETTYVNAATYRADHYLAETLGLNISHGRSFTAEEVMTFDEAAEQASIPAVISGPLAEEAFGRINVVGEVMYMPETGDVPIEIIGVAETFMSPWPKWRGMSENSIWFARKPSNSNFKTLAIRTEGISYAEAQRLISETIYTNDRSRVIVGFENYEQMRDRQFDIDHALLFSLSLIIVLLIGVISLGSVGMAVFNVERRTKQIGTRRALGASKRSIVSLFCLESGVLLGVSLVLAVPVAMLLNVQLMNMISIDSMSVVYPLGVGLALIVVSLIGILYPALKASLVPPSVATRTL